MVYMYQQSRGYLSLTISCAAEENIRLLFTREFFKLVNGTYPSIDTITDSCYSAELISNEMYDNLLELNNTAKKDKARKLLRFVQDIISQDSQALRKFLDILNENDVCQDSVKNLRISMPSQ